MNKSGIITVSVVLEHFHNKLWSYYVAIPKVVGDQFVDGDNRRVLCSLNGLPPIHAALMPAGDVYTIYVKNDLQKKLGIQEGGELQVVLEKDNTEYGMPLPESFEMIMAQDEEGAAHFRSLTMGKQRSLVYVVGKVKNVDSQIAKGLAIMHHLKEANGKLDFKRLGEVIKEYNQRR